MERAIDSGAVDIIGLARPLCTDPNCSAKLIQKSNDVVDCYGDNLVLGKGFWGNNTSSNLIKTINSFGQVGFYYW
ncbi:NADH:flavin oxidoreductase/NADH oxidase [Glaciecola nitratireducens FR1064]|uniref:NADH:flavin oxidoreductase/NADH oxidase n=2 Tax=Brumicola TaxID=3160924 RepID=G4QF08_GLANF|nr:NADH:flavin oxidoreductase/NADH oxidase [Glaciecola nitratireducens FR1064]